MGKVTASPAAAPADAHRHFAAKLGLETDPSDVHADQQARAVDFAIVDARSEAAFVGAHVPGAIHFPYAMIDAATASHFLGAPGAKVCVVYCWGTYCNAGDKAAVALSALGYPVKLMIGGIDAWRHEGYPIEGAEA